MTAMTDERVALLVAPFSPNEIGKLPRITCPDCSKSRGKACDQHKKSRCSTCGNYLTEKHIHLDYVGHADVTLRLIRVDPDWTWEPMATDEHGLPVYDTDDSGHPVGLWIRLTVAGVTRLGYGSCPSDQSDAVKVLIGDALRNAAMRFGVATDLWAKGDRSDATAENATERPSTPRSRPSRQDPTVALKRDAAQLHAQKGYGNGPERIKETFVRLTGMDAEAIHTKEGLEAFLTELRKDAGATPEAASA